MRPARLEKLHSVAELAAMVGRPVRTLRRQLDKLAVSGAGNGPPWRSQTSGGAKWLVNLGALRRAFPALFETRYVTHEEYDGLDERVAELEAEVRRYRASNRERAVKIRQRASPPGVR